MGPLERKWLAITLLTLMNLAGAVVLGLLVGWGFAWVLVTCWDSFLVAVSHTLWRTCRGRGL